MKILRTPLLRTPELSKVASLKPGVSQNIVFTCFTYLLELRWLLLLLLLCVCVCVVCVCECVCVCVRVCVCVLSLIHI